MLKTFLATLVANLIAVVILLVVAYIFIVPYLDKKMDLFHNEVAIVKTTIDNGAASVTTAIKNFKVFGLLHKPDNTGGN